MKKLYVLFLLFSLQGSAEFYKFTNSNGTYNPLVNPTIITTTFTDENYNLNLNSTFKVFGVDFACNLAEPLIVQAGFGAIRAENNVVDKMFSVDAFVSNGLKKRDAGSELSYTIEGAAGEKLIKVQWKNMTIDGGDPLNDFVNFQIWLKQTGEIEIHMGAMQISNPHNVFLDNSDGPSVGIFMSSYDFTTIYESQFLINSPANPSVDMDNVFAPLGGIPSAYHVYSFNKKTSTSVAGLDPLKNILVYPQPATSELKIEALEGKGLKLEIYSANGVLLRTLRVNENEMVVDISDLPVGLYIISASNDEMQVRLKIVKNGSQ